MSDDILLRFGADTSGAEAGARRVGESIGGLEHEFVTFEGVVKRVGERMLAIFAIHEIVGAIERTQEWANKVGEAAERMEQLSQITAISLHDLQGWAAVAEYSGKSIETIATGAAKMEIAFVKATAGGKEQIAAFQSLGIDIKSVTSAQAALNLVADKFSHMDDGPRKLAAATVLFGKAGRELIPILNEGSKALDDQKQAAYDLGATWADNEAATEAFENKLLDMNKGSHDLTLSFKGLSNMLADEFAPIIAKIDEGIATMNGSMVDSYRKGDGMKTVMDALGNTVKIVADVFAFFGNVVFMVVRGAAGGLAVLTGVVVGLGDAFVALWSRKDPLEAFNKGFEVYRQIADGQLAAIMANAERTRNFISSMNSNAPGPGGGAHPKGGMDDSGGDASARAAEQKKIEEENLRRGRDQLNALIALLDEEQKTRKDHFAEQMALEDEKLSAIAAEYNVDHQVSAEYSRELARREEMLRAHNDEMLRIDQQARAARAQQAAAAMESEQRIAESDFNLSKQALQQQEDLGLIKAAERLQGEAEIDVAIFNSRRDLERRLYDTQLNSLIQQRDAEEAAHSDETVAYAALNAQIEALGAAHNIKMRELDVERQASAVTSSQKIATAASLAFHAELQAEIKGVGDAMAAQADKMKAVTDQIAGSFASMFTGLASGTMTFANAWQSMGQMILGITTQVISKIIADWLAGETAKTAITGAQSFIRIQYAALEAGANSWATAAGIPGVGPFIAPALAAAAIAGVLALGSKLFSAEGGFGDVPAGGALTQLHANEMVLPAHIATPLRSAISSGQLGAANDAGPGAGGRGGGATYNIHAVDARSFERLVRSNPNVIVDVVADAHRNGHPKLRTTG